MSYNLINLISNMCMASPAFLFIYFFANFIFANSHISLYFLIIYIFSFISIGILKYLFEIIMGNTTFPLIGSGLRPENAINTGIFIDCNNTINTTYGMPSGHSLLIVVVAVFWSLYFLKRNEKSKISLLSLLAIIIMSSRVLTGKHTIQQVIIGALFGTIIGYTSFKKINKITNYKMKNYTNVLYTQL